MARCNIQGKIVITFAEAQQQVRAHLSANCVPGTRAILFAKVPCWTVLSADMKTLSKDLCKEIDMAKDVLLTECHVKYVEPGASHSFDALKMCLRPAADGSA